MFLFLRHCILAFGFISFVGKGYAQELQIQDPRSMRSALLQILPPSFYISQVLGTGQGELFLFVDPTDAASQNLVRNVQGVANVTVRYYLAPSDAPLSMRTAKRIWCSPDRTKVLLQVMLQHVELPHAPAACNKTVVEKLARLIDARIMRARPGLLTQFGLGSGAAPTEHLATAMFPDVSSDAAKFAPSQASCKEVFGLPCMPAP